MINVLDELNSVHEFESNKINIQGQMYGLQSFDSIRNNQNQLVNIDFVKQNQNSMMINDPSTYKNINRNKEKEKDDFKSYYYNQQNMGPKMNMGMKNRNWRTDNNFYS